MSTFQQSPGKQFVRSPARQRVATFMGIFDEESQGLVYDKNTSDDALFSLRSGAFSQVTQPRYPPFGGGIFQVPLFTGRIETYIFGRTQLLIRDFDGWGGSINSYGFSDLQNDLLTPTNPYYVPSSPADPNNARAQAFQVQGANAPGQSCYFLHRSPTPYRTEQWLVRRSRFRTSYPANGFLLGGTSVEHEGSIPGFNNTFTVENFTFISNVTIPAMQWYEVPFPFDYTSDAAPVENSWRFVILGETPAAWSARTGLAIN